MIQGGAEWDFHTGGTPQNAICTNGNAERDFYSSSNPPNPLLPYFNSIFIHSALWNCTSFLILTFGLKVFKYHYKCGENGLCELQYLYKRSNCIVRLVASVIVFLQHGLFFLSSRFKLI